MPPDPARAIIERYRLEWKKFGRPDAELPLMGISRHVVLADSSAEAVRIVERAYRPWLKHMELLWVRNGTKLPGYLLKSGHFWMLALRLRAL